MTQLAQPLAGVCMQIASPGDNKFHMKFIFYRASSYSKMPTRILGVMMVVWRHEAPKHRSALIDFVSLVKWTGLSGPQVPLCVSVHISECDCVEVRGYSQVWFLRSHLLGVFETWSLTRTWGLLINLG